MRRQGIIFFCTVKRYGKYLLSNPLQGLRIGYSQVEHHSSDILSYIPQIEPVGTYSMRAVFPVSENEN
jgi:hypothetical protein